MSEYVRKYASEEALRQAEATAVSSSSESSMSDFSEDEAQVKTKNSKRNNEQQQQQSSFVCSKTQLKVIKNSKVVLGFLRRCFVLPICLPLPISFSYIFHSFYYSYFLRLFCSTIFGWWKAIDTITK